MPKAKDDFELHTQQKQEQTYQKRRRSFIESNDLTLHPHYLSELKSNPHLYPRSNNHAGPDTEVKYLTPQESKRTKKALFDGKLFGRLIETLIGKRNIQPNQAVMFTRLGSPDGSLDNNLMMMEKHEIERNNDLNLKTNHSSFNRGLPVANAGFLHFNGTGDLTKVKLSSGHYAPNDASGVKLAMWAELNNAFNPQQVPILNSKGHQVDVSEKKRVETVNNWAASNPLSTRRRKSI